MSARNNVGRVASIHYKGGIKGEEAVDDRSDGEPLMIVLGDLQLPRGVEGAVMDMEVGEERIIDIPPELGYGQYQERLAQWYPRAMLKDGYGLQEGDIVFYTNPEDGHKQPAFVTDSTNDTVHIDFNHPFAGKTLEYWIELVDLL